MVVPVLITSCQVSEKSKNGPVTAQDNHAGESQHEGERSTGCCAAMAPRCG